MARAKKPTYTHFIFDADGVFTTGQFVYTADGKIAKIFGPHDSDGIKLLQKHKIKIHVISADKRGFSITNKRIHEDMGLPLTLVTESDRLTWFTTTFKPTNCIYMADGIHDVEIFKIVGYSIAPNNAFPLAKHSADFVTDARSGEGAVAEACLHVLNKFFQPFTSP